MQLSFNTANNQPTNAGIQYDAAGNLVDDSTHSYQYDPDGNLISVDSGATAVDVYDALNRRVRVQTASATDEYIYDYANRRISTWLPNGAGIEGRIYWGSLLAAFRAQNGDTYFDQKDILGTDRLRMNYAAAAAANYASLPFGDGYTANVSGAYGDQDNNHFAQLDRDAESDTDHAQFRQYYNTWGRWMSPDPYSGSYDIANPQSFNRYSYVTNNPLVSVDPSGLDLLSNCVPGRGCSGLWGSGNPYGGIEEFELLGLASTPTGGNQPIYGDDYNIIGYTPAVYGNSGALSLISGLPYPTGSAPSTPTIDNACTQSILNAVNNQFGTNAPLAAATSEGLQPGGQINVNIRLSGLTAAQFNAIQPGRYAPPGFLGFITGFGPSLHVVGGPSGLDPNALLFNNQNLGGAYSASFTAHFDSAWADNPFGAFLHYIIDVLGHKSRNPC